MSKEISTDFSYSTAEALHTNAYLWAPALHTLAESIPPEPSGVRRVFDLRCGNGAFARHLESSGFEVTGVDPSKTGIEIGNRESPSIRLEVGSAYEDLAARYGRFPAVVSLEVVEHVYYPRIFARCVHDLLEPGGVAIISTPYHSYLKNLVLALSGKMDAHFTALWDHGHIKFWSVATLTDLFSEQGMTVERVIRAGRVPIIAKSMILVLRK